jgi:hypothetical protein
LVDEIRKIPAPQQLNETTLLSKKGSKQPTTGTSDLKRKIRELKAELALRETEVMNTQRQLRFTKITDLEHRIVIFEIEVQKLLQIIEDDK